MELHDLEEYLGIVVDLEKNIYMQQQLMQNIQWKISSLGKPRQYAQPDPPKQTGAFLIVFCVLFYGGLIGIPFALWWVLRRFFPGFLDILGGLLVILWAVQVALEVADFIKKDIDEKKNYEESLKEYQHSLYCDQLRVERECMEKEVLLSSLQKIEAQNKSTMQTLENVYSLNLIYEKYRTFPQVCTLYEYIRSGRCTTLREEPGLGSGGAYNLLEQEALQKTIILKLDQILTKLDAIQATQYMLYHTIQEGNQKMNDILSGINQISAQIGQAPSQNESTSRLEKLERDSAVTAYNAERIEKELSYMNRMNYFAGKYDGAGMFRQRPPV